MSLKTLLITTMSLTILGGTILFYGLTVGGTFWALVGLLAIVGALVWEARCYRCPLCGSYLGRLMPWRDDFCSHCGGRIDWDEKQSWRK